MIISEVYKDKYTKTYSDQNYKIRQIETGRLFTSAVDINPSRFTYEETDIVIEKSNNVLEKARAYDILMGVE
jgi:hypothetical protein